MVHILTWMVLSIILKITLSLATLVDYHILKGIYRKKSQENIKIYLINHKFWRNTELNFSYKTYNQGGTFLLRCDF